MIEDRTSLDLWGSLSLRQPSTPFAILQEFSEYANHSSLGEPKLVKMILRGQWHCANLKACKQDLNKSQFTGPCG